MKPKILKGFAVAVIAPAIAGAIIGAVYMELRYGFDIGEFYYAGLTFGVGAGISLIVCSSIGLSVHRYFQRRRIDSPWAYIAAGIFSGAAVAVAIPTGIFEPFQWAIYLEFLVAGPVAAISFWWVVRPNYDVVLPSDPERRFG